MFYMEFEGLKYVKWQSLIFREKSSASLFIVKSAQNGQILRFFQCFNKNELALVLPENELRWKTWNIMAKNMSEKILALEVRSKNLSTNPVEGVF